MSYKYGYDYPGATGLLYRFCPDCLPACLSAAGTNDLHRDKREPSLRGNGFEPCRCLEPYTEPEDYRVLSPLSRNKTGQGLNTRQAPEQVVNRRLQQTHLLDTAAKYPDVNVWNAWKPNQIEPRNSTYWRAAELQAYLQAFRSTYSLIEYLDIPTRTSEDLTLLWFFQNLMFLTSEAAASQLNNSSRTQILAVLRGYFDRTGFEAGTSHFQVIRKYWDIFLHEVADLSIGVFCFRDSTLLMEDPFRDLVERYITCTLWCAFWNHREGVKPFGDWQHTMKILRRTTLEILEKHSHDKWNNMRNIRDRFMVRYRYAADKLRRNGEDTITQQTRSSLSSERSTWKNALKAVAKDARKNTPTTGEAAAALILAWSIDSKNEPGMFSAKFSPKFRKAVLQWVHISGSELGEFVKICWPSLDLYERTRYLRGEVPIDLLDCLKTLPNEAGELPYTEKILMDSIEADEAKLLAGASIEALAVHASLNNSFFSYSLQDHGGILGHQFAVDPGIQRYETRWCGVVVIMLIITYFLLAINIPGLPPLLLLSLAEFERSCIFADKLQSLAASTHTMIFDSQVIQMVRNGTIQTTPGLEIILLNHWPFDQTMITQFCDACVSYLDELGLEPFGTAYNPNFHPTLFRGSSMYREEARDGLSEISEAETGDSSPFTNMYSPSASATCSDTTTIIPSLCSPSIPTRASPPLYRCHRCRFCPKDFPSASNRRRHEKSVHGKPVFCQYCRTWIRDRADYKTKHAKSCKVWSRVCF